MSTRKAGQPQPARHQKDPHQTNPSVADKASVAEKWLALLPAPPKPFSEQDEVAVERWMRDVVEVGGIEGLTWAYRPENFPFKAMRPKVNHVYGSLIRATEYETKMKAEQAARALAAKQVDEQRALMKSKGWA